MADQKVSAMTDSGEPADEDLLYMVDVSAPAPQQRKLTIANLKTSTEVITPPGSTGGKKKEKTPHVETTNGTPTELFANGVAGRISIDNDTTIGFLAYILGRRSDGGAEESGFYKLEGSIKRNAGTVSMHTDFLFKTEFKEDDANWDVTAEADDVNKALVFKVTGAVGKTIKWQGWVQYVEVTG